MKHAPQIDELFGYASEGAVDPELAKTWYLTAYSEAKAALGSPEPQTQVETVAEHIAHIGIVRKHAYV